MLFLNHDEVPPSTMRQDTLGSWTMPISPLAHGTMRIPLCCSTSWNAVLRAFHPAAPQAGMCAMRVPPCHSASWHAALRAFHPAAPQTRSAYIHPLRIGGARYFATNGLHVGLPHPVGLFMGMAHIASKLNAFSANTAFCHHRTSSLITEINRDSQILRLSIGSQHIYSIRRGFGLQGENEKNIKNL